MSPLESKAAIAARINQNLFSISNSYLEQIDLNSGLYIYGAGELGALAVQYCEACGIQILGVLDRNKTGIIKGELSEYLICDPNKIPMQQRSNSLVAVAIATRPLKQITNLLHSDGWKKAVPFYALTSEERLGHPLGNGWKINLVSDEEQKRLQWICENWDDGISLLHYEAYLSWRINETELALLDAPINPDQRYVIEPLLCEFSRRNQQMIDVGSHRGESVKRLAVEGIFFAEYVLIEPDIESSRQLINNVKNYLPADKRISHLNYVLGASNTLKPFKEGLGYCSQLWPKSTTEREVVALDSLGYSPDFLKIHTEGSELDILAGGRVTISKSRPVLAFSVYHNRDGFVRAIFEPMKWFCDYRWFFRLHSFQGTGAFVYGIPR